MDDYAPRILAFAGATRVGSHNKELIRIAAAAAREAGAEVTLIDLRDFPMPLYDGDLEAEEGLPEAAQRLKALMAAHDGLLLSCPEYNSSITGVLKNTLDWASRPETGEPPLVAFDGKVAGLLSASPGHLGGLRGLVHVRAILGNIGVFVVPGQVAISRAHEAFAEDGSLKDDRQQEIVRGFVEKVVRVTGKLSPRLE
jgi:NAD(P)H-dependent FMN reductase